MRRRLTAWLLGSAVVLGLMAFLHDPPWIASMTSGLRDWEQDSAGTRFRWTAARASFYVPSDATEMTLPLRPLFPGPEGRPVRVEIAVDGRSLAAVDCPDPAAWKRVTLPLPRTRTHRRYRRVDLRVNRTVGPYLLGIQVGEPVLSRPG